MYVGGAATSTRRRVGLLTYYGEILLYVDDMADLWGGTLLYGLVVGSTVDLGWLRGDSSPLVVRRRRNALLLMLIINCYFSHIDFLV